MDPNAKGGALTEEMQKLMREQQEAEQQQDQQADNNGAKIKMGKIGGKKKKGAGKEEAKRNAPGQDSR